MITLDVAEYCHNCDGFEPKAEALHLPCDIRTVVRCVNNRKCFNIQRYLAKEMEKKNGRTIEGES